MKRLWIFAACLMITPLFAQDLKVMKGDFEAEGRGYVTQAEFGGTFRFGAFIMDYVQIGVDLGYVDTDFYNQFSVGLYAFKVFETNTYLLPYAGGGLDLASFDPEPVIVGSGEDTEEVDSDGDSGVGINLFVGAKYFIADNVSFNAEAKFLYNAAEAFVNDNEASDTDYRLTFGISYYW